MGQHLCMYKFPLIFTSNTITHLCTRGTFLLEYATRAANVVMAFSFQDNIESLRYAFILLYVKPNSHLTLSPHNIYSVKFHLQRHLFSRMSNIISD